MRRRAVGGWRGWRGIVGGREGELVGRGVKTLTFHVHLEFVFMLTFLRMPRDCPQLNTDQLLNYIGSIEVLFHDIRKKFQVSFGVKCERATSMTSLETTI